MIPLEEATLLFSERRKLAQDFEEWAKREGVPPVPLNLITWLNHRYVLVPRERPGMVGLVILGDDAK